MIVLLIALVLLLIEELLHRLSKHPAAPEFNLTGSGMFAGEDENTWKRARILSWIRVWELIVFGLLFAIVAASSGIRVLSTAPGHLAALLLLIQIARILNRRIIRQWAVLGGAVIVQVILIAALWITGLSEAQAGADQAAFPLDWLISSLSFLVIFVLTLSVPFSGTFFVRLLSREGSGFYYSQPPLAYSEYWIRRISSKAGRLNICLLLISLILSIASGYPLGPILLQAVIFILLMAGFMDFKRQDRLYHLPGIALISAAWCFNVLWFVLGLNQASRGWFA